MTAAEVQVGDRFQCRTKGMRNMIVRVTHLQGDPDSDYKATVARNTSARTQSILVRRLIGTDYEYIGRRAS